MCRPPRKESLVPFTVYAAWFSTPLTDGFPTSRCSLFGDSAVLNTWPRITWNYPGDVGATSGLLQLGT